jgi:PP-loop superfamily ATP-utilizing enzyme
MKNKLFKPGDFVAVAASGGKDSTVLAYIMKVGEGESRRTHEKLKYLRYSSSREFT